SALVALSSQALSASSLGQLAVADLLAQGVGGATLVALLREQERVTLRTALARLGESEERFRMVFEHSGVGMALLAPDGRILQVNPALTRMLGYAPADLQDRRLGELVHQEDLSSREKSAPKRDGSDLYEREKRYVHRAGHSVWARVIRVPVR